MHRLETENVGAMSTVSSGALKSHETASSRNQKRYLYEPLVEFVSVLNTVMSELVASNDAKDTNIE